MNKLNLDHKIIEIEKAISNQPSLNNIGFFSGEIGVATFYYELFRY
jgi:hypothetical protein